MGTCYYLVRRDNRTGYDLGKSYGWDEVFGRETSMTLTANEASTALELLIECCKRWGWDTDEYREYLAKVVDDIIDWSEGHPFEYHSEHSGLVEDLNMEGWDESPSYEREWITGDRHSDKMDMMREKRKTSPTG